MATEEEFPNPRNPVFDYRALRLLMGFIALSIPFVTRLVAGNPLYSISSSYYTAARDVFTGMMFVMGTLFWAYNGHTPREKLASKTAAAALIIAALFPTACNDCSANVSSILHYAAAIVLFGILSYFCFGPFRENTKGQTGKKALRSRIYFVCGCVMAACLLGTFITQVTMPDQTVKIMRIVYWAETLALLAFGTAWTVAGKALPFLVDKDEALALFKRKEDN